MFFRFYEKYIFHFVLKKMTNSLFIKFYIGIIATIISSIYDYIKTPHIKLGYTF